MITYIEGSFYNHERKIIDTELLPYFSERGLQQELDEEIKFNAIWYLKVTERLDKFTLNEIDQMENRVLVIQLIPGEKSDLVQGGLEKQRISVLQSMRSNFR